MKLDYSSTTQWLFEQLPMYQRVGSVAYKADLDNTVKILDAIGNPERKFKAIHIAGTNGKGSVAHIIASILQEAGYKTGLYTSPHLKDFRERIKVNGQVVGENFVVDFIDKHKGDFMEIGSSFFEMTVGMAFGFFASERVDIAVVETGLGGRLDSTNLCKPVVSVITNIGIDHTALLGNTLGQIAIEKAGIIKPGIPVVVGVHQHETDEIFTATCKKTNSTVAFAEDDVWVKLFYTGKPDYKSIDIWYKNDNIVAGGKITLMGNYQKENVATAVRSTLMLRESSTAYKITNNDIALGIENVIGNTGITGRWHKLGDNPLTICDTGHNIDGIKAIMEQINEQNYNELHFVLGMVNDKDIDSILNLLPKFANYYFCKPNIPRGLDADVLAEKAAEAGLVGLSYSSVRQAYSASENNAGVNDMIFIGGSTFVVAEIV